MKSYVINFNKGAARCSLLFQDENTEYFVDDIINVIIKIFNNYNKLANRDSYFLGYLCYRISNNLNGFGFSDNAYKYFKDKYDFLKIDKYNGNNCILCLSNDFNIGHPTVNIDLDNFYIDLSGIFSKIDKDKFYSYYDISDDDIEIEDFPCNIYKLKINEIKDFKYFLLKNSYNEGFKSECSNLENPYFIPDLSLSLSTFSHEFSRFRRTTGYLGDSGGGFVRHFSGFVGV